MKRGIFLAPFDELADPRLLAELACDAEQAGFDGFFLWDHVAYRPPVQALLDPWVCMAAIAMATERVVIGPLITPPARRRIHKLARETATLDLLSGGRFVFGAGLGSDNSKEFTKFGEEADAKARAKLLDEGLAELQRYWDGAFLPKPAHRIPIWLAANWPNRRPVRRAVSFDGLFPINVPTPDDLGGAEGRGPAAAVRPRRDERTGRRSGAVVRGGRNLVPDRLLEPAAARCRARCDRRGSVARMTLA